MKTTFNIKYKCDKYGSFVSKACNIHIVIQFATFDAGVRPLSLSLSPPICVGIDRY